MNDYYCKLIRTTISVSLCLGMQNIPAAWSAETASTAEVLPAETIFGKAKISYLAAKKVPDICAKLFCYCGCDSTDNHKSLLDCFTSDHGVDCTICQEEAIMAFKMKEEGKTLAQIQKAVDQKYVKDYNEIFTEPSKILLEYRQQRQWKPTPAEALAENTAGKTEVKKSSEDSPTPTANSDSKAMSSASGQAADKASKKSSGSCCGKTR